MERRRKQAKNSFCGSRRRIFLTTEDQLGTLSSWTFHHSTFLSTLSSSDVLWQLSDKTVDCRVIVEEWKNPEGFYASSWPRWPQPAKGHGAHHSCSFEGRNCIVKIHIKQLNRWLYTSLGSLFQGGCSLIRIFIDNCSHHRYAHLESTAPDKPRQRRAAFHSMKTQGDHLVLRST